MSDILANLKRCGFSSDFGPESPASISELERLIGVPLPAEYCEFLLSIGGGYLDAWADCTVPTPFGEHCATVLHSLSETIDLLGSPVTPRNMICIGSGHFGATTCLSIAGIDQGQVFSLDTEMRFNWDETENTRFASFDPSVREFFHMRDADELPRRPWGYDHCYHVANSFNEFIAKIRPFDPTIETEA